MSNREKRVVILADTQTHMMPALAKEMARRNHDLVLGDAADGLADECAKLGARVEVVPDTADQTKPDTFQKLVDRAKDVFGGFDSACIRTGVHVAGDILQAKLEDAQTSVDGNFLAAFYALKAVLPPLVEQKSGQVVVNTSSSGLRPTSWATLYSAQRAATNAMMQCAGQTVAPHGVTVCGTGTYAMDYPGYYEIAGVDPTPEVKRELADKLPIKKLIEPQDAANFVAPLLDGSVTVLTSQFFSIDGGWAFEQGARGVIEGVLEFLEHAGQAISLVGVGLNMSVGRSVAQLKIRYARRVACEDFYGTGLIDRLCELGKNPGGGGVLIPTNDMTVALVSQYRHRLEPAYRHSLPPARMVDLLMDKEATRTFAETNGFRMCDEAIPPMVKQQVQQVRQRYTKQV